MLDSLSDGAILIRPFRPADAREVYAAIEESRGEVAPWLPDLGATASIDMVHTWIATCPDDWQRGAAYSFAILDAQDGLFLGGCGLTQLNRRHQFANLYYWVRTSRSRRGVASAAIRLIARFGFTSLGLRRVEIVVALVNAASTRAAEKAGGRREGTLRNRISHGDAAYDAIMFSLIPSDLLPALPTS